MAYINKIGLNNVISAITKIVRIKYLSYLIFLKIETYNNVVMLNSNKLLP